MAGPSEALQKAELACLKAGQTGSAVGGRLFDEIPNAPTFPYVSIGNHQILADAGCGAAYECFLTLHVFSRPAQSPGAPKGKVQAKQIADKIIADMSVPGALDVSGFTVCENDEDDSGDGPLVSSNCFLEPDNITAHAVVEFRFLLDKA